MNLVDIVRKLWNNDGRNRPWGYVMPVTIVTAGNLDEEHGESINPIPVVSVGADGAVLALVPGGKYSTILMQNAAVAAGNGNLAPCTSAALGAMTTLTMQITGISGDTITFEATIDGTNFVALQATNLNTGSAATTATANGLYRIVCAGLTSVRARISTFSAGTITVRGTLAA